MSEENQGAGPTLVLRLSSDCLSCNLLNKQSNLREAGEVVGDGKYKYLTYT